jgi:hypothetical protein
MAAPPELIPPSTTLLAQPVVQAWPQLSFCPQVTPAQLQVQEVVAWLQIVPQLSGCPQATVLQPVETQAMHPEPVAQVVPQLSFCPQTTVAQPVETQALTGGFTPSGSMVSEQPPASSAAVASPAQFILVRIEILPRSGDRAGPAQPPGREGAWPGRCSRVAGHPTRHPHP